MTPLLQFNLSYQESDNFQSHPLGRAKLAMTTPCEVLGKTRTWYSSKRCPSSNAKSSHIYSPRNITVNRLTGVIFCQLQPLLPEPVWLDFICVNAPWKQKSFWLSFCTSFHSLFHTKLNQAKRHLGFTGPDFTDSQIRKHCFKQDSGILCSLQPWGLTKENHCLSA